MTSLTQIDRSAPEILSMVSFNEGNRYSQFDPAVDEIAAYGIAGSSQVVCSLKQGSSKD
jgi:uncharacterized membrane-anchored protein